jgi:site-specific DNA-methyltransferase (adenine-specific)
VATAIMDGIYRYGEVTKMTQTSTKSADSKRESSLDIHFPIVGSDYSGAFDRLLRKQQTQPMLVHGDASTVLKDIPEASVDFVMTSPPYWYKREYSGGGIGLEPTPEQFVDALAEVTWELKRVLKPTGSFWLNVGDTYWEKGLAGDPVAIGYSSHGSARMDSTEQRDLEQS